MPRPSACAWRLVFLFSVLASVTGLEARPDSASFRLLETLDQELGRLHLSEEAHLEETRLDLGWGRLEVQRADIRRKSIDLDGAAYTLYVFDGRARLSLQAEDSLEQKLLENPTGKRRNSLKVRELEWLLPAEAGLLPDLDWQVKGGLLEKLFGGESIRLLGNDSPAVLLETWLCEQQGQEVFWTYFRDQDLLVHELRENGLNRQTQAWRPMQRQHPVYRPYARLQHVSAPLQLAELPTRIAEAGFRMERVDTRASMGPASSIQWHTDLLFVAQKESRALWCRLDPAAVPRIVQAGDGGDMIPLASHRREGYPWLVLLPPQKMAAGDSLHVTIAGESPSRLAQGRLGSDFYRPRRAWHPCPDPRQGHVTQASLRMEGEAPATTRSWAPAHLLPLLSLHEGPVMQIDSSLQLFARRDLDPSVFEAEDLGSTARAFTPENLLDRERDWRPLNPAFPDEREAQERYLRDEGLASGSELSDEVEHTLEERERRRLPAGLSALRQQLERLLGPAPTALALRVEQQPRTQAARFRLDHLGPGALPAALSITHDETGGGDSDRLAQCRALARAWWLEGPAWSADTPAWIPEGLALHSALLALEADLGVTWAIERRREGLERALHLERFYTLGRNMSPALGSRCGGLWRDPVLLEYTSWRFAQALENLRNGQRLSGTGSDAELSALYRSLCRSGSPRILGWGPLLQELQGRLGSEAARQLANWMHAERLPQLGLVAQKQQGESGLVLRTRLLAGALPIELPVLLRLPRGEEMALLHVRQEEQLFPLDIPAEDLEALTAAPWHSVSIEELK